jgi:hypothetical protein
MTFLDDMAQGYIDAALWADCMPACGCEPGECDCKSGGLLNLEVSDADRAYIRNLCEAFWRAAGDDLDVFLNLRRYDEADGSIWEHIGHYLRLTSGGHGTGFWDRTCTDPARKDEFDAAARSLSNLATSKPFTRIGGGDCWQDSMHTATFDHWSLDA